MSAPPTGRGAAVRFPFPPLLFAGPLVAALMLHRVVPWSVGDGAVITFTGVGLVFVGLLAVASGVAAVVRAAPPWCRTGGCPGWSPVVRTA